MGEFEKYLSDFTNTVDVRGFLLNLFVAALLATVLRIFYVRFGNSVSNRERFGSNFLPLALTTMLIITIVKSSIALSLGLVGALSIVRFRAAIKDPEELTYLFLVIGIGLACGAGEPLIALMAITLILIMIYINNIFVGKKSFKSEDKLYLNLNTDVDDLNQINAIVMKHMSYVELKRMDKLSTGLDLSFICKAKDINQINALKDDLGLLSPATTFSIIDQPDLIV